MSFLSKKRAASILSAILVFGFGIANAQEKKPEAETFKLTIDSIMEGSALTGTPPAI